MTSWLGQFPQEDSEDQEPRTRLHAESLVLSRAQEGPAPPQLQSSLHQARGSHTIIYSLYQLSPTDERPEAQRGA